MYKNNGVPENIDLPENIDDYISRGIKKGKRKKSSRRIKHASGVGMCLVLVLFIAGIRVSPVLASNVAQIPGLKYIVELVRFDKGLLSAIENDYIQNVNKSCEKLDLVFTVKDIIADNDSIILFYSIKNKGGYKLPRITNPKLLNLEGRDLKVSNHYGFTPSNDETYEEKIEFYFNSENKESRNIPDSVILRTQITVTKSQAIEEKYLEQNVNSFSTPVDNTEILDGTWEITISIDKSKFSELEKVYKIDQNVEIEGQKILFEDIKIYPTKSILSVSFDKANSKNIFYFENLKLVDEKGQEWGRINSGVIGTSPSENSKTLYFQSNYFYKPKELYITGDSIRALEKKECYFTLDVQKKQITYSPYNLITITEFSVRNKVLSFRAEIQKNLEDLNNEYQISNEVLDANGNKLDVLSFGAVSSDQESYMNYTLKLNDNFKGPITFNIIDYPSKIKGAFKVGISLDR